jgi:WG containing repeat
MTPLKNIAISDCGTFHLLNGEPLYSNRFLAVLKFASIGFAAVKDSTGAYHINYDGKPAYNQRFDKSYGFYCNLAAVAHHNKYFHIKSDGTLAYHNTFSWVGNFQENLCVIKDGEKYYHIDESGNPAYKERYNYVGDFKDGIAVVYQDGLATHIDNKGCYIHNKWFKQLDVYHKGYARAEDDNGWFHIDTQGNEVYSVRYKNVEPFYNDLARVETFDGAILQINYSNEIITAISSADSSIYANHLSDDMVGFWKTFTIYTGVKLGIFDHLPANITILNNTIQIPEVNLNRILKALWELNLVIYDVQKDVWGLTEKGKLLQYDKHNFLNYAAILWANVAAQDWLKLPELLKSEIKNHASFKDAEVNEQNTISYLNALEGYAVKDIGDFFKQHSLTDKKIIGFGRTSLGLIKLLTKLLPNLDASVLIGAPVPHSYLTEKNIKIIDRLDQLTSHYDVTIFLRFLHYFNNEIALKYLKKMNELNIPKLMIFETIISYDSPIGGLLDVNMIIETGGKLRTIEEWQQLFKQSGYSLTSTKQINSYLTLLEVGL